MWSIAKSAVLALLASIMIALLYRGRRTPRGPRIQVGTPGSFPALLIWMTASAGFAFAGVIVFLVWLWITNLAILLGLEFDAELGRQRGSAGGLPRGPGALRPAP